MKIETDEKEGFRSFKLIVETYEEAVVLRCRLNVINSEVINAHGMNITEENIKKCIGKVEAGKMFGLVDGELDRQNLLDKE